MAFFFSLHVLLWFTFRAQYSLNFDRLSPQPLFLWPVGFYRGTDGGVNPLHLEHGAVKMMANVVNFI